MIKVNVDYRQNRIVSVKVKGHALYDQSGKDIVCAGVSAVSFGAFNSLIAHGYEKNVKFDIDEGKAAVKVLKDEHDIQVILETLVISLKSIEETYKEYITVKTTEV